MGVTTGETSGQSLLDVTDQSFAAEVIDRSSERTVVVDFWAPWCQPCRTLGPLLEAAVAAHGGVTLAKLDTDGNTATTAAFGIRGIPAVKAFRDGRVVDEFVGLKSRAALSVWLAQVAPLTRVAVDPADEAGLRTVLDQRPGDARAAVALARLLIGGGALDEAEALLLPLELDPAADGLRARIALLRDLETIDTEREELRASAGEATGRLITRLASVAGERRELLRRVVVGDIAELGPTHQQVAPLRAQLSAALF